MSTAPERTSVVSDLQGLFPGIRLGDEELAHIHAQLGGIDRVQRVLGIDESRDTASLLRFRHCVESERGLAGTFRTINLDDAALRQTANTQGNIQPQRTGGNRFDIHVRTLAELHHGALAECLVDLAQRGLNGLLLVRVHVIFHESNRALAHSLHPLFHAPGVRATKLSRTSFVPGTQAEHFMVNKTEQNQITAVKRPRKTPH